MSLVHNISVRIEGKLRRKKFIISTACLSAKKCAEHRNVFRFYFAAHALVGRLKT